MENTSMKHSDIINYFSLTPPKYSINSTLLKIEELSEDNMHDLDIQEPYKYGGTTKVVLSAQRKHSVIPKFEKNIAYEKEITMSPIKSAFCNDNSDTIGAKLEGEVRIMSMNVHNFVDICDTENIGQIKRKTKGRTLNNFTRAVDKYKPDIIFTQEMTPFPEINMPNEIEMLDPSNFNFVTLCKRMNNRDYNNIIISDTHYERFVEPYFMLCNGIFSKYAIIESATYKLTNNRICMYALIKISENKIVLCFNVHLEDKNIFTSVSNFLSEKASCKEYQINLLAKIIYEKSKDIEKLHEKNTIYYILGGDFNAKDAIQTVYLNDVKSKVTSSTNYFRVINEMMTCMDAKITSAKMDEKTTSYHSSDNIIDRFYVATNSVESNKYYNIALYNRSDHFPILYDVKFAKQFEEFILTDSKMDEQHNEKKIQKLTSKKCYKKCFDNSTLKSKYDVIHEVTENSMKFRNIDFIDSLNKIRVYPFIHKEIFDNAFDKIKFKINKDVVLYRYISDKYRMFSYIKKELDEYEAGDLFSPKQYISATTSPIKSTQFGNSCVKIFVPNNTELVYMKPHSVTRTENEVVLKYDCKFVTLKIETKNMGNGGEIKKIVNGDVISISGDLKNPKDYLTYYEQHVFGEVDEDYLKKEAIKNIMSISNNIQELYALTLYTSDASFNSCYVSNDKCCENRYFLEQDIE